MARTARAVTTDVCAFLFAVGFSVLSADAVVRGRNLSDGWLLVDQATGAVACLSVFLRRRWPVGLAVVLLLAGTQSHFVTGAALVALFTVATHRPPRTTAWVAAFAFAPLPFFLVQRPDPEDPRTSSALVFFALVAGAIGWGLFARSRRQLIASLRDRAERAAVEARRQAREDIAREMHDVLAHRLSLLSVHAGALEFNPGAPPDEIGRAAGVIRDSAHQALQDLREIIDVLRADGDAVGAPQPVLADLERLARESRTAGMRVALRQNVADPAAAPPLAGRTAYRVVQEGLTNARKHAPDEPVTVTVSGGPGDGLTVEIRNPAPGAPPERAVPGAGMGLIGLRERAGLAGGRLEHTLTGEDFRLTAWLPWPASP
ncbi:sensor histidine kinase [Streptomyces sp. PT12]|uniref:sensor histidine kinase n=1 Tax=Streptomyces sp. PT12 TaxID=1510197 RepID=UPI000DE43F0C|nr:histidine kinase [Streptomyces sp. PT12]RBM20878.1 two-component sensor histidine kinase [Streptomyces sp. PT12]